MPTKKSKKRNARPSRDAGRSRSNRSSNIDELFANGEPAEKFSNLPGNKTYEGHIKAGSAIIEPKSDSKDDYRASFILIVTSPKEYKDRQQMARFDLSTQIGVNIFLAELETMELGAPSSLKEAAEMLEETDEVPVRFWVSEPEDEFPPKVRINERLEGNGGNSSPDSGQSSSPQYTKAEIRKLGKDADNNDDAAMDELIALAKESDFNEADYDTWMALAKDIIDDLGL